MEWTKKQENKLVKTEYKEQKKKLKEKLKHIFVKNKMVRDPKIKNEIKGQKGKWENGMKEQNG